MFFRWMWTSPFRAIVGVVLLAALVMAIAVVAFKWDNDLSVVAIAVAAIAYAAFWFEFLLTTPRPVDGPKQTGQKSTPSSTESKDS